MQSFTVVGDVIHENSPIKIKRHANNSFCQFTYTKNSFLHNKDEHLLRAQQAGKNVLNIHFSGQLTSI